MSSLVPKVEEAFSLSLHRLHFAHATFLPALHLQVDAGPPSPRCRCRVSTSRKHQAIAPPLTTCSRPGSGKSTLAYPLADRVNELILGRPVAHPAAIDGETAVAAPNAALGTGDEVAICVGQDGWHYTRQQLDEFPDPKLAHWRRVSNRSCGDVQRAARTGSVPRRLWDAAGVW